ncbi:MAG: ABC transporter substrate-binding protein [Dehalococcoidia bacterium]
MTARTVSTPTSPFTRAAHVEDVTRRGLMVGALATALFVACGDDRNEDAPPTASTRTITTKYGTYDIPTDPQRIVLMENRVELETAAALGLSPIAIGKFFSFTGGHHEFVAPWVPFTVSNEQFFDTFETDIEAMLQLRPDLIVSGTTWLDRDDPSARSYSALRAVAPVVPINVDLPWREALQEVAGWLGREDRLAETLREFDALRDGIKQKHASRIQHARVAYGSYESPNLFLRDFDEAKGPATKALSELGGHLLPLSVPVDPRFQGNRPISMENLRVLEEADAILIWAPDPVQRAEFMGNPLWPLLPAVRAGRAVVAPQNVGAGFLYTIMECLRLWDQVYATLA